MEKETRTSFDLRTVQDYFENLVLESYEDFKKYRVSSKLAITCAIFTWHFYDWLWANHKSKLQDRLNLKKKGDFQEFLFNEQPAFRLLCEIANGSKHFDSEGQDIKATRLQHGFMGPMLGILESHLTIRTDTQLFYFDHILMHCIEYWRL